MTLALSFTIVKCLQYRPMEISCLYYKILWARNVLKWTDYILASVFAIVSHFHWL
jgi:hypothetical protein